MLEPFVRKTFKNIRNHLKIYFHRAHLHRTNSYFVLEANSKYKPLSDTPSLLHFIILQISLLWISLNLLQPVSSHLHPQWRLAKMCATFTIKGEKTFRIVIWFEWKKCCWFSNAPHAVLLLLENLTLCFGMWQRRFFFVAPHQFEYYHTSERCRCCSTVFHCRNSWSCATFRS